MSYVRKMVERDKNMRLTVGCRAAINKGSHWAKYSNSGRHILLLERSEGLFSVLVLKKGFTGKLKKDVSIVTGGMAWVNEEDLTLVDMNFAANLEFIDWFASVEEDICRKCYNHVVEYGEKCPGCGCKNTG